MPIEPRLPPLPSGKLKIHAEHFRRVRDRIETIKPVPKQNGGILSKETEDGRILSIDPKWIEENVTLSGGISGTLTALNVCSNGQPDVIYVYTGNPEEQG